MDQDREELLSTCDTALAELLSAVEDAQQRTIDVAKALQNVPKDLTDDPEGGGWSVVFEDAYHSLRTARHSIRDIGRIGLYWRGQVAEARRQDSDSA